MSTNGCTQGQGMLIYLGRGLCATNKVSLLFHKILVHGLNLPHKFDLIHVHEFQAILRINNTEICLAK